MKNHHPLNNNASYSIQSKHDHHRKNSETVNIIRSIVDELYREEIQWKKNFSEKQVRFSPSLPIKSQSNLTHRFSKVDSTNDRFSIQCHSATQTIDTIDHHSSNIAHQLLIPGEGKVDDHFSMKQVNERRRLEEIDFSFQSLRLMLNDDLIYIDDLIKVFLSNPSEFHRILINRYHIPIKQAILTSKIIEQWWNTLFD